MPEGEEPRIRVVASGDLAAGDVRAVEELFREGYRDADVAYLGKTANTLRYLALAEDGAGLVGFSFGDSVLAEVPRLGAQPIALAGVACIAESVQRRGLFRALTIEAMRAGGALDGVERFLFAGRMAHAVTYRAMARNVASTVPSGERPPSAWHRQVASVVAGLYGVEIDPKTFVVRGTGAPIGFPRLEYRESESEAKLFAQVDRSRGESLLAMCWVPTAPEGW